MTVKTYDPKCAELAQHFLFDVKLDGSKEHVHALALEIQRVIEDYIEYDVPRTDGQR